MSPPPPPPPLLPGPASPEHFAFSPGVTGVEGEGGSGGEGGGEVKDSRSVLSAVTGTGPPADGV